MPDPLPSSAHSSVPTPQTDTAQATPPGRVKPLKPQAARSLLERLSDFLMREPEDRQQLMEVLHHAHERNLLDADALSMMEGVLQVSDLAARDIMIPRAQMDMIDIEAEPQAWLPMVLETSHSRFPVYEGNRDRVIGILLAKDLLRYLIDQETDIRGMLRPAVFIPESKRLNVLLRDFRINRNHMALVVDEYGGVAGLVTIEDVLEQIVGDIEDEYDFDEEADNILLASDGRYRVRALTEITHFNETFGTQFSDEDVDTVGGLISDHLGRVPRRGEKILLDNIQFEVLRADARQVHLLLAEKTRSAPSLDDENEPPLA
ncbi:HlyC/CorC family transporter [Parvibium lacunae]|uniref:Magnesium and cobalt efflux protein CorC n=1 Tax=Parvibium lacunae TaxID=1888893 RepID=A0A368L4R2_9BURK|nr:transporter associated domain-containing protein [Parvibium lacunae]RCS58412.1 CBS domain-containing protein [Parvibium lacunae]